MTVSPAAYRRAEGGVKMTIASADNEPEAEISTEPPPLVLIAGGEAVLHSPHPPLASVGVPIGTEDRMLSANTGRRRGCHSAAPSPASSRKF